MLKFQSRELEFEFNKSKHKISYPTVMQLRNFSENYEKNDDKIGMIYDLVIELGMKKEDCEKLEIHMLEDILKELTTQKK